MSGFDIERIFWSRPRVVKTSQGPRRVRTWRIPPRSAFWELWETGSLREQGYTIRNWNGDWMLTEWCLPNGEPSRPQPVQPPRAIIKREEVLPPDVEARYQEVARYYIGYLEEIGDDYLYQLPAIRQLVIALLNFDGALDASDTGVGKTAVAVAVARVLGRSLFVVCPKNVVPPWLRMAEQFKVQITAINYEMIRTGKTEWGRWAEQDTSGATKKTGKPFVKFVWQNVEVERQLLVFDECHKMKDYTTLNCEVGIAALDTQFQVLALSATAADNPLHMKFIALLTGLIRHPTHYYGWMMEHGVRKGPFGLVFGGKRADQTAILSEIHHRIFPAHGARIKIVDLGDRFPHTRIVPEAYAVDNAAAIDGVYRAMREEIAELRSRTVRYKARERAMKILMAVLKARQEIELLKVPLFAQLAKDGAAEGNAVVMMMNYDPSIMALDKRLTNATYKGGSLITGAVTGDMRQNNIDSFNADESPFILLNIKAGGLGIGLHGTRQGKPRLALISPTPSGIDLKQAVGRLPRAGGAHSLQRILFAADTVEERMLLRVRERLRRVSIFNDDSLGDLDEALAVDPVERQLRSMPTDPTDDDGPRLDDLLLT